LAHASKNEAAKESRLWHRFTGIGVQTDSVILSRTLPWTV